MNKNRRVASMGFRSLQNGEQGLTLVEVLVALGILAAVAVVFLLGMTTSSKAVMVSQERVAADSLAKSEMEYVKSAAYHSANVTWSYQLPSSPPSWDPTHSLPYGYGGYSIDVTAEYVVVVPGHTWDDGIQKITVTITRGGETVLTLEGYKVNR